MTPREFFLSNIKELMAKQKESSEKAKGRSKWGKCGSRFNLSFI